MATPSILIVDDDHNYRAMICEQLRTKGYTVVAAPSGREALWQIDDFIRDGKPMPGFCIVDFHMPDMTGYDLIHEIKRKEGMANVPILMLSQTSKNIQDLVQNEGIDYLSKTSSFRAVLEKVQKVLGAGTPQVSEKQNAVFEAAQEPSVAESKLLLNVKYRELLIQCFADDKVPDKQQIPSKAVPVLDLAATADSPLLQVARKIVDEAVLQQATEIYIEPAEKLTEVRFAVQGLVAPVMELPAALADHIMRQIAALANLNVIEFYKPQRGSLSWVAPGNRTAEFNVTCIPSGPSEVKMILNVR